MADCDRHYSADREALAKAYPGKKWRDKVLKMSDQQVHATLINIKQRREKEKNGQKEGT